MASIKAIAWRLVKIASALDPKKPFYPYQQEFAFSLAYAILMHRPEEFTALFSRQSGKTETVARIVAVLLLFLPALSNAKMIEGFEDGFWVGIFAPVREQARTTYQRLTEAMESKRYVKLMQLLNLDYRINNQTTKQLDNFSVIMAFSASPGANIESKTLHLAIAEESQDIGYYKIRKSIEPMLTSTLGVMCHIGTANEKRSPFHDSIQRNRRLQRDNPRRKLHFEFDYHRVMQHNPNYRQFIEHKLADRGSTWLETDEFRMGYALEFLLGRGMFCSIDRLMELEALGKELERQKQDDKHPVYFGIDWGKSSDSTVVTAISPRSDHFVLYDWLELVGDDYEKQYPSILQFINRYQKPALVLAESNGVGDPLVDRLKSDYRSGKLRAKAVGFQTTLVSKSDGYKSLLNALVNSNRLLFPAHPEKVRGDIEYQKFCEQLTDLEKEWKGSNMSCSHPDKQDAHDDYCDSLMLAHWAASEMGSDQERFDKFYGF